MVFTLFRRFRLILHIRQSPISTGVRLNVGWGEKNPWDQGEFFLTDISIISAETHNANEIQWIEWFQLGKSIPGGYR